VTLGPAVQGLDTLVSASALPIALDRAAVEHRVDVMRHSKCSELDKYLGKARFFDEVAERTSVPGMATGLAWTLVGGDILVVPSAIPSRTPS